jgi:hypothetical protein
MLANTQVRCRTAPRCGGAAPTGRSSRHVAAPRAAPAAAARAARAAPFLCRAPAALLVAAPRSARAQSRAVAARASAAAAEVRFWIAHGWHCAAAHTAARQAPAPELSGGLSEDEAVANIVKAVMGAGVFSLPWAVAQGGIVFVPAFILGAAVLALHTLAMLVAAKRKILQLRPEAAEKARARASASELVCATAC